MISSTFLSFSEDRVYLRNRVDSFHLGLHCLQLPVYGFPVYKVSNIRVIFSQTL